MKQWPLKNQLTRETPGEEYEDPLTGNVRHGPPTLEPVDVYAWQIIRSEEATDSIGSVFIVEVLRVYAPPGVFDRWHTIITPDGARYGVSGNAADATRGAPGWKPGLVTYHAERKN